MEKDKLKILYIHHYGKFGGASKSLHELVNCFKEKIDACLISQNGLVPRKFSELGFSTITTKGISIFDHTVFGYYRGFRWLILLRELFYLPFTFNAIRRASKKNFDLIHINDVSLVPALIFSRFFFKQPIIVHARIVLLNKGWRYSIYRRILKKFCYHLIAIDKSVHLRLPLDIPTSIIHNGLKPPHSTILQYNETDYLKVGMIGGLIYMKGLLEFVESAKILKSKNAKVKFIIVGESPTNFNSLSGKISKGIGLARDIKEDITEFLTNNGLEEMVELRPFTLDVGRVYEEIDVLCFANHADAAGRPVFEAAFYKKPSICSEPKDIMDGIIHMETGLCVESKNPTQLADAIEYFYLNRTEVRRMGENAYHHACENFDINKNAEKVFELYKNVLQETSVKN